MVRKLLALIIALMLCRTAHADLFYYSATLNTGYDDTTYDFGRITETSSGTFQKGPALKTGLNRLQMFSAAKYKGHDRLILTDSDAGRVNRIFIYNPNNLDTPIANCDLSSLDFIMSGFTEPYGPVVWGDNLLLGGRFQGSGQSGIIEVNPETGELVNSYRYNHEKSTCYDVIVCGNKIYTSFGYTYSTPSGGTVGFTDYAEMSSLGVIMNELTGIETDLSDISGIFNHEIVAALNIAELDGKLYADYQITSYDAPGVIECGVMRFDSAIDFSAGYKVASFRENSYTNMISSSGGNDGFVFYKGNYTPYNNQEIYFCDGSGSVQKVYTISPYTTVNDSGRSIMTYPSSMHYDKENGRIFITVITSYNDPAYEQISQKLVVFSRNSSGGFSVSQEIDGIGKICFVEPFSGSDSPNNNNTPPSDDNNNPDDNPPNEPENPNNNPNDDNSNNNNDNPNNDNNNSNGNNSRKSSGGGGCSSFTFPLLAIMLCSPLFRKQ